MKSREIVQSEPCSPESVDAARIRGNLNGRSTIAASRAARLVAPVPRTRPPEAWARLLALHDDDSLDPCGHAAHAAATCRRRRSSALEIVAPPHHSRADAQLGDAVPCRPMATRPPIKPFFGHVSAGPCGQPADASQRSLIGPDEQASSTGGMVELDTGNARYLIRFTQTLERQAGWAWSMFNGRAQIDSLDRRGCSPRCWHLLRPRHQRIAAGTNKRGVQSRRAARMRRYSVSGIQFP